MAKKATSSIVLTAALELFAVDQIHAFDKAFQTSKGAIGNMSNHLLDIAKRAEKDGGKAKKEELYKALCRHAETVFKQEHMVKGKEQPINKLLPFWPVAKSQVLAGLKAGSVLKFKTVYELVDKLPKKARTPKTPDAKTGADKDDDSGLVSMPTGPGGEGLAKAVRHLHNTLRAIVVQRPTMIEAAARAIEACCDSLEEIANLEDKADANGTNNADTSEVPAEQTA